MLRRSAQRFPGKTAIIRDAVRLTYAELDSRANQLARALLALGLAKGAKVAIVSRNLPEYAVAFFGLARSGCVLVNVSVLYAPDELAWVLQKADVELLLFDAMFQDKVRQVVPLCLRIRQFVRIDSPEAVDGSGVLGAWPQDRPAPTLFTALLDGKLATSPDVALEERDPFCMTYTGGTTCRTLS